MESVEPVPALPARSVTPVLVSVMRLVVSSTLELGVKVAVQVMPPSEEETLLSVPLAMLRSALVKPVTASLKVMVTRDVSPSFKAVSATTMVAVGRAVSTARVTELLASRPSALALPATSVNVPLATLTTPLAVLPGVGVNTAV